MTTSDAYAGRRLTRSRTNRRIAGVCGGIAEYFAVDPTLVRVVMVVLAVSGAGLLLYPLLWLLVPNPPAAPVTQDTAAPPVTPAADEPAA